MQAKQRSAVSMALTLLVVPTFAKAQTAVSVATEAVRNATADPMAVQFRMVVMKGGIVCGEYNAKNAFGAYTGFEQFAFDPQKNEGFMLGSLARISRTGVVESGDGIIRSVREAGLKLDSSAVQSRMDKLIEDASAMLLKCA